MIQEDYEDFTEGQRKLLSRYVTNTSSHIFVLRNLPEVIKGALFSRYSRSKLGLRSLLLKEFISNEEEAAFEAIVGKEAQGDPTEQEGAIKRAQDFYDRILDGYGDDSIGELGGAHLAVENVSMLAAKVIEDNRIGGSPLEKSTRYIYFDKKVNGEYQYYREPILMTSAYRDIYINTCNMLFDTYCKLIPSVTEMMEKIHPFDEGTSKVAYSAALRAKVLDCLRGLLPVSTLTNMGVFGNGRFFEGMIRRLQQHNLTELNEVGQRSYEELSHVIPSFVRRATPSHKHYEAYDRFQKKMEGELRLLGKHQDDNIEKGAVGTVQGASLVYSDPQAVYKVAASLLFPYSSRSLAELEATVKKLPEEDLRQILDAAALGRENRRHKSPRALERAEFTFELVGDFGAYRDLQRHRMLSQERQLLSCDYGYYIPQELVGTEMLAIYQGALDKAKEAYDKIASELSEEAQYVVPMAYNIRWYFHVNLRALQWITELRSSAAGHPSYRLLAQEMAKGAIKAVPEFERFFQFVDYNGYELGRLGQEERNAQRKR